MHHMSFLPFRRLYIRLGLVVNLLQTHIPPLVNVILVSNTYMIMQTVSDHQTGYHIKGPTSKLHLHEQMQTNFVVLSSKRS